PDRAQVAAQPLRVERLAGLRRGRGADHLRIDAMIPANLDAFDVLCGRDARGPQACDNDQPRTLHIQLLHGERVMERPCHASKPSDLQAGALGSSSVAESDPAPSRAVASRSLTAR